jgi:flagellar biosynthesis/type III secretory pathway protein FliH
MKQIEREEVGMTLVTSFEEIGREDGRTEGRAEGRVEGRMEGQQELVLRLLTRKLGPLSAEVTARIAALESATMLLLADALLDFATQDDLRAWLDQRPGTSSANAAEAPDQAGT